jgi:hypothetical protein
MNTERNTQKGTIPSSHRFGLIFLLLLFLTTTPALAAGNFTPVFNADEGVHYNQTYVLSENPATPFEVWAGAIFLGVFLLILSFMKFPLGEEGLISILAWFPLGFATYSSFAVDFMGGFGAAALAETSPPYQFVLMELHTVYHFDVLAVGLLILTGFAIGNTLRIWVSQRRLRELSSPDQGSTEVI